MKTFVKLASRAALAALLVAGLSSCESSNGVSVSGSVGVGMYYGSGYYDPWYYGPGYGPPVVVVPPPPPGGRPPPVNRPTPLPARPMPSRPMPRGGRR
jgi:hypothetical protein